MFLSVGLLEIQYFDIYCLFVFIYVIDWLKLFYIYFVNGMARNKKRIMIYLTKLLKLSQATANWEDKYNLHLKDLF